MPRPQSVATAGSTKTGRTINDDQRSRESRISDMTKSTWSKQKKTPSTLTPKLQQTDPPSMLQTGSKQLATPSTHQPGARAREVLYLFTVLAATNAEEGKWVDIAC